MSLDRELDCDTVYEFGVKARVAHPDRLLHGEANFVCRALRGREHLLGHRSCRKPLADAQVVNESAQSNP